MSVLHINSGRNLIKRIIAANEDGEQIGYDQFDQLMHRIIEHGTYTYHMIPDLRAEKCALCGRGWETTIESMRDYNTGHITKKFTHDSCYNRHIAFKNETFITESICHYMNTPFRVESIPNGYDKTSPLPWFLMTLTRRDPNKKPDPGYSWANSDTPFTIKYGPRKRVDQLELLCTEAFELHPTAKLKEIIGHNTYKFTPQSIMVHTYTDEEIVRVLAEFQKIYEIAYPVKDQSC